MTAVLHLTSWYRNPWNQLEAPFIKEHFDALHGRVRQELWHVQVRDDGPGLKWRCGQTSEVERYAVFFAPLPSGRAVEWLTLLLLIFVRLRLGRRWWDVVNVHVAYPLLRFPKLFRWLFGPKVVITEHWSAYHRGFNLAPANPGRRRIAEIFHHNIPVVAVSQALLTDIVRFAGTDRFPKHVVPNVVDPRLFFPSASTPKTFGPICLMVASWAPIKRPLLAMAAFAKMLSRWPSAQLRVIGGGQQLPAMKEFVHRAKLEQHIVFLGPRDKAAVASEMRSADLFLHSSEYETFSVVCAEALCSGLPVIASNVGGIPEFVDKTNGLLVENTDKAWTEALERAFSEISKWDRVTIAESARERFTPDVVGSRLRDTYISHTAR